MAESSNEEIVTRYVAAHRTHDHATLGSLRHREWVCDWPQSGERVRGHDNDRAIMENWPGRHPEVLDVRIVGTEDRWVMTPLLTLTRIVGNGDFWWTDGTGVYGDGSRWFVASLFELRDHLVYHERWIFSPELEAPAWRSQWVEPLP